MAFLHHQPLAAQHAAHPVKLMLGAEVRQSGITETLKHGLFSICRIYAIGRLHFMANKRVLTLLVLVGSVVAADIYTRTPLDVPAAALMPEMPAATRTAVLVVHGSVDSDNPQFPLLVQRLEAHFATAGKPDVAVRFLNWSPWSDTRARAAATAEQLGSELGKQFATLAQLDELQLVVHSSGAYVADSLCESYRANAAAAARVTMVFLDPFQLRGLLDFRDGARNHGRCADFALAVINTDDPAPTTSAALAQAWNIDITALPHPAGFTRNGHYWPVRYYLDYLPGLEHEPLPPSHEIYPRGGITD